MNANVNFEECFQRLTGHPPLSWQTRLYRAHFAKGELPLVIDLPTGLGKTMVMAIWLIARAQKPDTVPTRLIYVVDRRTVVDQATDLAMQLREKCPQVLRIDSLAISTLRGQLADNREWSRDPSRPAIIIGTVDLIGSALLFSGYRSSYKRRPLEAGLLGQDSLLVLDEAHLSKPFEKLVCAIGTNGRFDKGRDGKAQGKPLRVIRMSATSNVGEKNRFKLEDPDLVPEIPDGDGELERNPIVERFEAKKTLRIERLVEKQRLADRLADEAVSLVAPSDPQVKSPGGTRIVVFVRTPDMAHDIAERIRKSKKSDFAGAVEVLTGTMRGLERDELVKKPVLTRFLDGDETPGTIDDPVFLISTSAGEVGFDLNADHLVCDAATIDSLIQRLGRVNRRGKGNAQIRLFVEPPKKDKDGKPKKLEGLDLAIANTQGLLQGVTDVSSKNIAALKASAWKESYAGACSPTPTMVELTDILLDAWSMTSITQPMPGRPEVGPWLRGIDDELPQTTIAWRAELDLDGFAELEIDDIEEWFDTHRILTHETHGVPTHEAAKRLVERWNTLDDGLREKVATRPCILDRACLRVLKMGDLIQELSRKPKADMDSIRNANLILPASFGGIERGVGLLDADAPKKPENNNETDGETRNENARNRLAAPDVADIGPGQIRLREVVTTTEEGESEGKVIGNGEKPPKPVQFTLDLGDDERRVRLVSYVPRRERPDVGSQRQPLHAHVDAVRSAVDALLKSISLPDDSTAGISLAAQFAADFHDHGKNRERWQRTVGGEATPCGLPWGDTTLGKSDGRMKRDPRGYRHEFGSLREFTDAFSAGKLLDTAGKPISQDVFDLAMHLIAAHHGRVRPHFPKGGFDPDCESRSDEIHTEAIRRFARLQREYGWWYLAWLENLLRCADALASADNNAEDDPAEAEGCEE